MSDEINPGPFYVGLCMAGAVSAGAYTAGVMDYLLEALAAWEEQKKKDPENTPRHDVRIPVMGGASAGGMTALISGMAIHEVLKPLHSREEAQSFGKENKLYDTWVNLTRDDMLEVMLDRSDLEDGRVYSVLNSDFIEELARKVVKFKNRAERRHSAFTDDLRFFVTMSNLKGMQYSANLSSGNTTLDKYLMSSHKDYACFQLEGARGRKPGWMKFDVEPGADRSLIADSAMATGAFPAGLKNRKVSRPAADMIANSWFSGLRRHNDKLFSQDPYEAYFVDGGMINNEPFDRVREILLELTQQGESATQDYKTTKSTVLMIDPFPSEEEEVAKKDNSLLTNSIAATLGAMVNHLRIKPATLLDAMHSDRAGQFLISPVRYPSEGKAIEGKKALACGSLSGFAGFIHKDFREHDFFLGRANCERFLRKHFTMPVKEENPYIAYGYGHLSEERKKFFEEKNEKQGETSLPIIPIFTAEGKAPYIPDYGGRNWPILEEKFLDGKKRALRRRIGRLIIATANLAPFWQFLLWIGNHAILRRKMAGAIMSKVKSDLRRWKILQ